MAVGASGLVVVEEVVSIEKGMGGRGPLLIGEVVVGDISCPAPTLAVMCGEPAAPAAD